ncbi:HEAT repeat domain-containing protein [Micromonospora auratinigra]|uniref:HEAT repeat domain-containing protein n=1 Tax=Micromonospora auratinigra TaxID=261654 RepID=UPI000B864477|nr:HEAT repeat domain-containing protein [Micromonospora auratinigra]
MHDKLARLLDLIDTREGDAYQLALDLADRGDQSLVVPVRAALARCLERRDTYGRDLLVRVLVGLSGSAAFPYLLRTYAHPVDPNDDRDTFALHLGNLLHREPAACRPTVLAFVADPAPELRQAGLWALGHVLQPDDADVLREALADPDQWIRWTAVNALPDPGREPWAYGLVRTALRDPEPFNRRAAVLILAWSAAPSAADDLLALTGDSSSTVRSALGEAIGRTAAGSDRRDDAATVLLALLDDPDPTVRRSAARGLGHLDGPLDALRDRADDPDPWVRKAVAVSLGSHAGDEWAATLATLAADQSAEVRWELAAVLARQSWPGARPLLAGLAEDPDPTVRRTARTALERGPGTPAAR